MEIERKWMVTGWPTGLEQTSVYSMDQGYISVRPTVRIRREALQNCFCGGGLFGMRAGTQVLHCFFHPFYKKQGFHIDLRVFALLRLAISP